MPKKLTISDPTKILTLANIISLSRAILAVPIIYTLKNPSYGTFTFILILIAVLSDALDGWVARKAHEVTHFGKWIDPIADFVCIFAVVAYLTLIGQFPAWFFLFFLVRYIFIAKIACRIQYGRGLERVLPTQPRCWPERSQVRLLFLYLHFLNYGNFGFSTRKFCFHKFSGSPNSQIN